MPRERPSRKSHGREPCARNLPPGIAGKEVGRGQSARRRGHAEGSQSALAGLSRWTQASRDCSGNADTLPARRDALGKGSSPRGGVRVAPSKRYRSGPLKGHVELQDHAVGWPRPPNGRSVWLVWPFRPHPPAKRAQVRTPLSSSRIAPQRPGGRFRWHPASSSGGPGSWPPRDPHRSRLSLEPHTSRHPATRSSGALRGGLRPPNSHLLVQVRVASRYCAARLRYDADLRFGRFLMRVILRRTQGELLAQRSTSEFHHAGAF